MPRTGFETPTRGVVAGPPPRRQRVRSRGRERSPHVAPRDAPADNPVGTRQRGRRAPGPSTQERKSQGRLSELWTGASKRQLAPHSPSRVHRRLHSATVEDRATATESSPDDHRFLEQQHMSTNSCDPSYWTMASTSLCASARASMASATRADGTVHERSRTLTAVSGG